MQTADKIFQAEETASAKALRLQRVQLWELPESQDGYGTVLKRSLIQNEVSEVGRGLHRTKVTLH